MIYTQLFRVTGVANSIAYDDGLKSTEAEKKRLLSVRLVLNGLADNDIQGYYEREKIFDIPDRLIDTEADTYNTNYAKPGARINEIEVGFEIPVGQVFKVAIKCGASAKNLHGCYVYEKIT
jgi:hypothetical protein